MSDPRPDENEDHDLRQLLQAKLPSTGTDHDAAVLQAARNFARSETAAALEARAFSLAISGDLSGRGPAPRDAKILHAPVNLII